MNPPVHKADKKHFLTWFLKHYELKKIESKWILIYLRHHEDLLDSIHFVRDARFCPRAITISTKNAEQDSFRFYRDHIVTENIDKAFHDIRLNPFEPLYIQLFFPNWNQSHHYAAVLEENLFIANDFDITPEDKKYTDLLLNKSLHEQREKQILLEIDQALDTRDEKKFIELSKMLGSKNEPSRNR